MNRLLVNFFLIVALDTLGNNLALVTLPSRVNMDVCVAVGAHDTLGDMYAGVMFGVFLLVAAFALHLLDLYLLAHMLGEVSDVHVTTGTGIFAVDRCREF